MIVQVDALRDTAGPVTPPSHTGRMRRRLEDHVRAADRSAWTVAIRGRPHEPEDLLLSAKNAAGELSWMGEPALVISAAAVSPTWVPATILSGRLFRTRRATICAPVSLLVEHGFDVLPTFADPHISILLPIADIATARRLRELFGAEQPNPHYRSTRRKP